MNLTIQEYRAAVAAEVTEAEVQAQIVAWLSQNRIVHTISEAKQSFNQKGQLVRRLAPGWPDVTAIHPQTGQFIGIEVKRPVGGRLRYEQAVQLESMWRSNALIIVARAVADVAALIQSGKVPGETLQEITAALARGPGKQGARRARHGLA